MFQCAGAITIAYVAGSLSTYLFCVKGWRKGALAIVLCAVPVIALLEI